MFNFCQDFYVKPREQGLDLFQLRKDLIMIACLRFAFIVILALVTSPVVLAQTDSSTDPLVRMLQAKGVLTESEARSITANASTAEQRDRLATLLRDKGVISTAEFEAVRTNT